MTLTDPKALLNAPCPPKERRALLLVVADLYEESGKMALARGLRKIASRRKWPKVYDVSLWIEGSGTRPRNSPGFLDPLDFEGLKGELDAFTKVYETTADALLDLAHVLGEDKR